MTKQIKQINLDYQFYNTKIIINFIIKMSNNDYTVRKDQLKGNSQKSDFSFSSPYEDATVIKQALMTSRHTEIMKNRVQLFSEMKQNASLVSFINKSYPKQFVEQIKTQHRLQVEKLLLQISRLHDLLEDQERNHKHMILRLKEESQQIAILKISNLKQSQYSQLQIIEMQLKKNKEALEEKNIEYQQLQKTTHRKIQTLTEQNQKLKTNLKQFVDKKNNEIYLLRNQLKKQNQNSNKKQQQAIQQLKSLTDQEIKKILKKLQQKQKDILNIQQKNQSIVKENYNLQKTFEIEKIGLNEKIQKMFSEQRQRYNNYAQSLKQYYEAEELGNEERAKRQKQILETQLQQLMNVIKIKDEENKKNLVYIQTQKIYMKLQFENLQNQNKALKQKLHSIKSQHLQQIQILKAKMGLLHSNDIESLVKLYEAKLQSVIKDKEFSQQQTARIIQQMKKQRQKMYQMKKKYDYTVSSLHEQIYELKVGASHFQKDMKEKIENEKSMMLMTSRNFIKESQIKANNIKFYQQELRKLRQLLEVQAQQVQESQKNVQQKIKLAQDELTRLSNKILQVKSEAQQSERKLKQTIQEKNNQIRQLNSLLNAPRIVNKQADDQKKQIKRLDQELAKKEDQLRNLKIKAEDLQKQNRMLKSEIEKLIIQNQVNSQDAKKQYKVVSDKNLADFRLFYERRMQQLQNDKKQLGKINSSQSEQITELIKKYNQLQAGMRQLLRQTKRRGDLQARIINVGMDNNLVKNMAELFHK